MNVICTGIIFNNSNAKPGGTKRPTQTDKTGQLSHNTLFIPLIEEPGTNTAVPIQTRQNLESIVHVYYQLSARWIILPILQHNTKFINYW